MASIQYCLYRVSKAVPEEDQDVFLFFDQVDEDLFGDHLDDGLLLEQRQPGQDRVFLLLAVVDARHAGRKVDQGRGVAESELASVVSVVDLLD